MKKGKPLILLLAIFLVGEAFCQEKVVIIPDKNFRKALIENKWYGMTKVLIKRNAIKIPDISKVKTLRLRQSGIKDLTGIEAFTALTSLNCSSNCLMYSGKSS